MKRKTQIVIHELMIEETSVVKFEHTAKPGNYRLEFYRIEPDEPVADESDELDYWFPIESEAEYCLAKNLGAEIQYRYSDHDYTGTWFDVDDPAWTYEGGDDYNRLLEWRARMVE